MRIRARPLETIAQKGTGPQAATRSGGPGAAGRTFGFCALARLWPCPTRDSLLPSFPSWEFHRAKDKAETPYEKVVQVHLDVTTASRKRLPARQLTGRRVRAVHLTTPIPLFIPARVLVQFGLAFDSPHGITRPLSNLARAPPRWTRPHPTMPCERRNYPRGIESMANTSIYYGVAGGWLQSSARSYLVARSACSAIHHDTP